MRRRCLRIALLAAAAIVPCAARSKELPDWAAAAVRDAPSDAFPDADAVVLLDSRTIDVVGGARRGVRRWVCAVQTEAGANRVELPLVRNSFEDFGDVTVWTRSATGFTRKFDKDVGRLYAPGSIRSLDDTQVLLLSPPGIGPGSVVAVEYVFMSKADFPQDLLSLRGPFPVVRAVVEAKADPASGWRIVAETAADPAPREVAGSKTWTFDRLPALPTREDVFAPRPPGPDLALDFVAPGQPDPFASWASTAGWVGRLFDLPAAPRPALDAEAERIRSEGGDPVEAAGRLARGIRYFGLELGWGGYRPRPPETSFSRGLGDCKDKALLMVAVLRRLGVEAVPVLAALPDSVTVLEAMPGPRQFDHAIVGVPWSGRSRAAGMTVVEAPGVGPLRLFDATLPPGWPSDLGWSIEGGAALVLDPRTTGIIRIHGGDASGDVVDDRRDIRVDAEGKETVVWRRGLRGAFRAAVLDSSGGLAGARDRRERIFDRLVRSEPGFEGLELSPVEVSVDGEAAYSVSFGRPRALDSAGGLELLRVSSEVPAHLLPPWATGVPGGEIELRPSTYREAIQVALPGRTTVRAPGEIDVSTALGRARQSVHVEQGSIAIEREVVVTASAAGAERREDLARLRDAVRLMKEAVLVLRPTSHDPTGSR